MREYLQKPWFQEYSCFVARLIAGAVSVLLSVEGDFLQQDEIAQCEVQPVRGLVENVSLEESVHRRVSPPLSGNQESIPLFSFTER